MQLSPDHCPGRRYPSDSEDLSTATRSWEQWPSCPHGPKEEEAGGSGWDARKKKSEFLQRASITIAKGNSRVLDCMRHDWQSATAPDLVTVTHALCTALNYPPERFERLPALRVILAAAAAPVTLERYQWVYLISGHVSRASSRARISHQRRTHRKPPLVTVTVTSVRECPH